MRDHDAEMNELHAKLKGKNVRLEVTRLDFFAAIADPAWRGGALGYADAALNGVTGHSEHKLRCLVCSQPWARHRPPCVMAMMKITAEGFNETESIIAAICPHCIYDEDGFQAALQRLFGGTHHVLAAEYDDEVVGHA